MYSTTRRSFLITASALPALAGQTAGSPTRSPENVSDRRFELISKPWSAQWISAAGAPANEYGVYHFRLNLDLGAKPSSFVVHVSGDNRYQLFVNGKLAVWGPARGDLYHWRFETVDLARFVDSGRNTLAAVVWNFGQWAPEAQITLQTGFLLQGDSEAERVADTGSRWKAIRDEAYAPIPFSHGDMRGYFVAGPGENIDGSRYPWGWAERDFDDSSWKPASEVAPAAGALASDVHSRWMLVPRNIPFMDARPERLQKVRRQTGIEAPADWPARNAKLTIPARTRTSLLLDQTYLTTGYPELTASGGRGSTVQLRYAECLQIDQGKAKGNRNEIEGKDFIGYHDLFHPDGGTRRQFRPLWWRTWRYVEMNIETADEPLTIDDLASTYTGYPFEMKAKFEASDASIAPLLGIGWRTARLCAHETYMDCPYYEQLQYVGDTRIQALISLFDSGDPRLVKNAIELIDQSRLPVGATMSRYPTRLQQFIPAFSLWWVGMVHDYWRYVDDPDLVRRMLPGVRAVLSFYESYQGSNGLLRPLPWWRFMDWANEWKDGDPPQGAGESSSLFDMLHLIALDWGADLESALGMKSMSEVYRQRSAALRTACQQFYWDGLARWYADTPKKDSFSQHAQILAVLGGVAQGQDASVLMARTLKDDKLVKCSLFFRHYLHAALNKSGLGDRYLEQLADWHTMVDVYGLTTFAEILDQPGVRSRSDCHAWSASPNYELFHTVLGIDSAAPGFRRVTVRPFLANLTKASGSMPHPQGSVEVSLEKRNGKLEARVRLPLNVPGEFVWNGRRTPLQGGANELKFAL
jgi:alpha-L-rhamnosidase